MSVYPSVNPYSVPSLVSWRGLSGRAYSFQLNPIGATYPALPGVYVFCRNVGGLYYAVYVGETENFWRRLTDELRSHHRFGAIQLQGGTHIGTLHVSGLPAERLLIETDLRQALNPPCNRQ